jgi:hypothetical protein
LVGLNLLLSRPLDHAGHLVAKEQKRGTNVQLLCGPPGVWIDRPDRIEWARSVSVVDEQADGAKSFIGHRDDSRNVALGRNVAGHAR